MNIRRAVIEHALSADGAAWYPPATGAEVLSVSAILTTDATVGNRQLALTHFTMKGGGGLAAIAMVVLGDRTAGTETAATWSREVGALVSSTSGDAQALPIPSRYVLDGDFLVVGEYGLQGAAGDVVTDVVVTYMERPKG